MRPLLRPFLLSILSAFAFLHGARAEDPFQALVRPTEALSPEEERVRLKVWNGFTVQLFASEPMINKPINLAFDERGRLWVSSTVEYPFPAEKDRWEDAQGSRVRGSRDAIKILEDTDRDGRADKVTDFADGLNIPIGVLPYGRGCIAWSIPNIWYFEDIDNDGRCDRRTVLFGPLGYERDTHGNIASLRLGEDGWVYATHGFNNLSTLSVAPHRLDKRAPGSPGTTLELKSGSTFRFRPDGSAVERWTYGQVNPFGLCFDAWGQLYSADCHSDPITQLIRGATYSSFGLKPGPLGFGPTMCPHRHGSTGLCGLVFIDRGRWGPDWDNHMLVGNCVTSRIHRDHITYLDATARAAEQVDFLVSEDPWFRPVDLQLGPDQALYVADFYNKIIGHYEVDRKHPGRDRTRGRIWRIVKKEATAPRPLTAAERAAQDLRWGKTGAIAVAHPRVERAWLEQAPMRPQVSALSHLLQRLEKAAADPAMLYSARVAVRETLALPGGLAELDRLAPPATLELRRIVSAVDTPASADWLLRWLEGQQTAPPDLPELLLAIARKLPESREGTLVKLLRQRFGQGGVRAIDLLRALAEGSAARGGARDPQLIKWAAEIARELLAELEEEAEPAWTPLPHPLGKSAASPWAVSQSRCTDKRSMRCLTSLAPPRGGEIEKLTGILRSRGFDCPPALDFWLCGHRGFPKQPPHERNYIRLIEAGSGREIIRAYPPRNDTAHPVHWDLAATAGRLVRLELVDGDEGTAFAWLAAGRFEPAEVPIELPPQDEHLVVLSELINAYPLQSLGPRLARQMSRPGLRGDTLVALAVSLARFPGHEKAIAEALVHAPPTAQTRMAESLVSTAAGARQLLALAPTKLLVLPGIQQKAAALDAPDLVKEFRRRAEAAKLPPSALDQLITGRAAAFVHARASGQLDPQAGEQVFTHTCASCHSIAGKGGAIGPALDGVKNRGVEALLTDILDPNRAVDPAFRQHLLTLKDGSVAAGMVRREDGATLVLADAAGQERTVPKIEIAKREESTLSLMPSGLGDAIPEGALLDLVAWLMSR